MPHIQAEPGDFSLLTPNMKKRTRDDVLARYGFEICLRDWDSAITFGTV